MKKISIKDIAREAGVSNATVSLVLNGKEKEGRVSKEVAARVKQIASDLDYQPNNLAKSLKSGHSYMIGLIVADISNPFFGSLAYFVQEEMEKAGYTVMVMNTNESDARLEKIITNLSDRQVDGYIIVPTEHGEPYISRLLNTGVPLVLLDRYYPSLSTYNVMTDSYQASYQATKLLIAGGCKKMGLISYKNTQSPMNERRHGFMDALQTAGLYHEELVKQVDFLQLDTDIPEAVASLLGNGIDGLLCAANTISSKSVHALLKNGKAVPEQVKVVGFDRSEAFEFMPHPIPYVQQHIEAMGRKAADLLIEQMASQTRMPQTCKFPATLIIEPEFDS